MRAGDVDLLRRYEPIVRYTHGESFFPMTADDYVAECDLWAVDGVGQRSMLVPSGQLTIDDLAAWTSRVPDRSLFLRFVQEPVSGVAAAQDGNRAGRPRFSAPSRLARVGIIARLIDAGFDLSLLVRGTVPGGTVTAAELKYAAIRARNPAFSYYGRVVRHAGWTVCQYLLFYAMNDWRSSFAGANDHEADWEQCFVFLEEHDDGSSTPVWFARAAHDEVGADLRRRWDDRLLQREGDHPIVFAGAGSHAAYIEPGEYLQAVPLRLPRRIHGAATALRQFWATTLGQGQGGDPGQASPIAAVPFVDYARGDGVSVGPGQSNAWTPILIDDDTPWVAGFEGLFGLDTEDRLAGERAPAGPKWTRDGRPRQSWIDPIAFAGLDATPPPGRAVEALTSEIGDLRARLEADRVAIAELERTAQRLGVRVVAAQRAGRSEAFVLAVATERDRVVQERRALRAQADDIAAAIGDSEAELARVRAGDHGDPRAHLHLVVHPQDPAEIRRSRLLDVWSAVSVALAILLLGALLITDAAPWWVGLLVIAAGYVVLEALVRRRLLRLLLELTILLAVVGAAILLVTNLALFVAAGLLAIGYMVLRDNVRELRSARG
jgi:hypothetical protein